MSVADDGMARSSESELAGGSTHTQFSERYAESASLAIKPSLRIQALACVERNMGGHCWFEDCKTTILDYFMLDQLIVLQTSIISSKSSNLSSTT